VLGFGFLILVAVQTGVSALRSWSVTYLGTSLNLAWTTNVFSHLLKLPEDFFQRRHVGDIVSRFDAVSAIQHTITARSVEVILDGLMATLTLIVMLVYSPSLALISIGAFLCYGLLRTALYHALKEATLGNLMASAHQQSLFLESIRGVRVIRTHNQSAACRRRLNIDPLCRLNIDPGLDAVVG